MPPAFRVLHAIHDYLPRHPAGSEIYVAHLCAAQRRAGLQPAVVAAEYDLTRAHGQITWRMHDAVPVAEVVNNWHVPGFAGSYRDPGLAATLDHILDIVQPHVLHVHNLLNLSFSLPAMAHARGIGVAATLHDYTLVCPSGGQRVHRAEAHICRTIDTARCARCFPQSPFHAQLRVGQIGRRAPARALGGVAAAMRRWVPGAAEAAGGALGRVRPASLHPADIEHRLSAARDVFAAFDVVVAPSAALAREFTALGFPPDRLVLSDYGMAPLPHVPRQPRPDGRLRVGFIGTLVWHKGADLLVDAAARLPADLLDVHIIGDTNVFPRYADALRQRAAGLPVRFVGPVDHDRIASVFAQIDVLVVPSRWLENSPLVIHEAFMAGVPVVGAAIGGIEELLGHGRHGLLVPPDDARALAGALQALLETPDRLWALARDLPRVKTVDDDAAEWLQRYRQLLRTTDAVAVPAR